jgi:hypothetical protein
MLLKPFHFFIFLSEHGLCRMRRLVSEQGAKVAVNECRFLIGRVLRWACRERLKTHAKTDKNDENFGAVS